MVWKQLDRCKNHWGVFKLFFISNREFLNGILTDLSELREIRQKTPQISSLFFGQTSDVLWHVIGYFRLLSHSQLYLPKNDQTNHGMMANVILYHIYRNITGWKLYKKNFPLAHWLRERSSIPSATGSEIWVQGIEIKSVFLTNYEMIYSAIWSK